MLAAPLLPLNRIRGTQSYLEHMCHGAAKTRQYLQRQRLCLRLDSETFVRREGHTAIIGGHILTPLPPADLLRYLTPGVYQ